LSREWPILHQGQNSGYQAVNLAYLLGATRILLLGYDMQMKGDQRHWFGAHPPPMEVGSNYPAFLQCFATIKPAEYGIEIWNVTRETALQCFPLYDLDECYAALSSAPAQACAA